MSEKIDWLYDYLLKFLQSPGWRSPILSFIDHHCSKFSPSEENQLIYSEIHNVILTQKFKEMIDKLLEDLRVTLGVTQEQLLRVCEIGRSTPEDRKVFHQIFACDNFLSFKKLMVKRNLELESEKPKVQSPKRLREERKARGLTLSETGFAINLSREAFKGYLKQIKREKDEQKKEWNVRCVYVGSKSSAASENGLIDLKIKVNQAVQSKLMRKGKDEITDGKSSLQEVIFEEGSSQPIVKTSEFSSGIEESLEAKRLSLKEEELRIHLERMQLEEEKKKVLEEKNKLLEKIQLQEQNKEFYENRIEKRLSILNFSQSDESLTPGDYSPESQGKQKDLDCGKEFNESRNSEGCNTADVFINAKTPNQKLLHLESMFQSYLSK
jgi:hypothetical protein